MSTLLNRLYTPADRDELRRLWAQVYQGESVTRREAAFRWVTERNPLCPEGAPRHLVLEGDRVVGSLGRMPIRFRSGDRSFVMHWSHDLLVDPECRGRGLGKILAQAVARDAPTLAGGLWMTDACCRLHVSAGWSAVTPFQGHRLVIDAAAALKRRLPPALASALGPPARVWQAVRRRGRPSQTTPMREIPRFDRSIDALFERSAGRLGIIAERNHEYLNWKYTGHPHVRYTLLEAGPPGDASAYAVLRLDRRPDGRVNGLIIDLLVDPTRIELLRGVLGASVDHLRRAGAQVVYGLLTWPPGRRAMDSLGFHVAPHVYTFVVTGETRVGLGVDLLKPSSWYLTLGDSDGDMWAGAQDWAVDRQETLPARAR